METDAVKIPPPVIVSQGDTNTHLSYIRRDIDQQKIDTNKGFDKLDKSITEINVKLDNFTSGFVNRVEFAEHLKIDNDHENRLRILEEDTGDIKVIKRLVYGCAGLMLTSIVMAIIYLVIQK